MKLIIEDDEGHKTTVPFVREEITVGRQDGNTIRLTERNVSRKHARFFRKSGGVFVEDLQSHNGIKVNGDRIEAAIALKEGDLVQIGDYDLAVQGESEAGVATNRATVKMEAIDDGVLGEPSNDSGSTSRDVSRQAREEAPEPDLPDADEIERDPSKPAAPARGAQATAVIRMNGAAEPSRAHAAPKAAPPGHDIAPTDAPRLVMVSTENAGREFACLRTVLTIGRGDECDIPIEHRSLSREHARLERQPDGQWKVIDLGSSNRVQVNGEEYADSLINSGDVITLGHVKLRFVAPGEDYTYAPEGTSTKRSPAIFVGAGIFLVAVIGVGVYFGVIRKAPVPDTAVADNPTPKPPPPLIPKEKSPEPERVAAAPPEAAPPTKAPEPEAEPAPVKTAPPKVVEAPKAVEPPKAAAPDEVAVPDAVPPKAEVKPAAPPKEEVAAAPREERHPAKPVKEVHAKPDLRARPDKAPAETGPTPNSQATQLRTEAEELMRDGKNEPAIAKLRQALKLNEKDPQIHKVLGGCLANDGEMDEAAKEYKRFMELAPTSPDVPRVRAMLDAYNKSKGN